MSDSNNNGICYSYVTIALIMMMVIVMEENHLYNFNITILWMKKYPIIFH
jgi:type IV secretory pathway VirB3-like protein